MNETRTRFERQKTAMEKKIKEMQEKFEEVEPYTTLPVIVKKEEVKLHKTKGTDFDGDIDFIKQTIVDCLANSQKMKADADKKMQEAVEAKVGKKVSIITFEEKRDLNTWIVYKYSSISFQVRGLIIFFFTKVEGDE